MLNGLDPIIIFQFYNLKPKTAKELASMPLLSQIADKFTLPPIPIYLSETLTGLYIDTEEKVIDIDTTIETLRTGDNPIISQRGIGNVTTVNLVANKNSIGLTLLSVLFDAIFNKVTSQEYSLTYFHGATTIFNGMLHTFSITQKADSDLSEIKFEIMRSGLPKAKVPIVGNESTNATLNQGGQITGGSTPAAGAGGGGSFSSFPRNGGVPIGVPKL